MLHCEIIIILCSKCNQTGSLRIGEISLKKNFLYHNFRLNSSIFFLFIYIPKYNRVEIEWIFYNASCGGSSPQNVLLCGQIVCLLYSVQITQITVTTYISQSQNSHSTCNLYIIVQFYPLFFSQLLVERYITKFRNERK